MSAPAGTAAISLVVLPGAAEIARHARDDVFADVLVAGTDVAEPAGELVAFLRAGDRFAPGKLERQASALARAPRAALCVTGHRRVDRSGRLLAAMSPDPGGPLLVSGSVEISTVLVRRSALPPVAELLALLERPGGDVVLCAQLADEHAVATLPEPLVDVLLDPARHGTDPARRAAELVTIVTSAPGRRAGPSSGLRRELLARLYVELEPATAGGLPSVGLPALDLVLLAGDEPPDAVAAVIEDLQWALERQAERIAAERTTWPAGGVDAGVELPAWPDAALVERDEALAELHTLSVAQRDELGRLHAEVAERDATIAWLHREVAARDGLVAERDGTIAWLHREVAARDAAAVERDATIARLHGEVAARDAAAVERDATIARLHGEVAGRDGLVADRDATIAWLHGEVAARDGEIERLGQDGEPPR